MKRILAGAVLGIVSVAAQADPCTGKVAVSIVAYDRMEREALALVLNQCGRPVRLELLVVARNHDGFIVAKTPASAAVTRAEPLSVVTVDLPFVQSEVMLSDYAVEIKKEIALGYTPAERVVDSSTPEPLVYRDARTP